MFTAAYIDTALALLGHYQGQEPFHLYLKHYYGVHKKFGSRDRRFITQLCYCWFRASHALQHLDQKQQLTYALFLCSEEENALLEQLDKELNAAASKSLDEKLQYADAHIGFQPTQLFPWNAALSNEIACTAFNKSFLIQPDLFLRLRPGKEELVEKTLRDNHIPFENVAPHCLAVSNKTKVDALLNLDLDAVVQDLNSQQVLNLVAGHYGVLKKLHAWDCCAASGGKSLLLADTFSNVHLTVSDVRERILYNLRKRFQQAGLKKYRWFLGDAATGAPPHGEKFDLIICDAPCSGSGTWSRTPEQLHSFKPEKIKTYAQLQKNIVSNVSQYVKPGGLLLYCTCSVFEAENEGVVSFISERGPVRFLKSAYYKGYAQKADTLFTALFQAL